MVESLRDSWILNLVRRWRRAATAIRHILDPEGLDRVAARSLRAKPYGLSESSDDIPRSNDFFVFRLFGDRIPLPPLPPLRLDG
jgi:hypothetical protein